MLRRWLPAVLVGVVVLAEWGSTAQAQYMPGPVYPTNAGGQYPNVTYQPLNRFWYYPYQYFPHNYWPAQGPKWPEPVGAPYQPPPAYMAYPPFKEPGWRYDLWEPHKYHRGAHFWLDQF